MTALLTPMGSSGNMLGMTPQRNIISYFLFFLFLINNITFLQKASAEAENNTKKTDSTDDFGETVLHSDRFIFRGKNVDDLFLVFLTFERGIDTDRIFGEFLGAVFEKNQMAFLEGSAKYPYQSSDFENIFPSYHTKVEGTSESGFILSYDGGDYTLKISSGPVVPLYQPHKGETLKRTIGIAEAVVTVHGKEYWGDLIHESMVWKGFTALSRHEHLYKNYQAFYLKTEKGRQIYLHQNKADNKAFLKKYPLSESLQSEGGFIIENQEIIHSFKAPIPLTWLKEKRASLGLYTVPQQWRIDTTETLGSLFIWPRGEVSKNWFYGGYYLMAIEGQLKEGDEEERVWGLAEYFH